MPPGPPTPALPPAPKPVQLQLRGSGGVQLQQVNQLFDTLKKFNVPDDAANQIVQQQTQLKIFYAFVNDVMTDKSGNTSVDLRLFDEPAPHADQGWLRIDFDSTDTSGHMRMLSEIIRAADHHYLMSVQIDASTNTIQWIMVINGETTLPS